MKQEPVDFWDEGPKAAPQEEEPAPEKDEPGGKGKEMRERMRQIRLKRMRDEKGITTEEPDDDIHLQDYKDSLAAHQRYKVDLKSIGYL